jgi:toxin ParE1/3/4
VLRLLWSAEALDDLETIIGYIADRNPEAADRLLNPIEHLAEQLPEHPYLYRAGRVPGTREAVVHPNYILVYRVDAEIVDVLAVQAAISLSLPICPPPAKGPPGSFHRYNENAHEDQRRGHSSRQHHRI